MINLNRNEIYISRQIDNLGHKNAEKLVKKAALMTLKAEGIKGNIIDIMLTNDSGIKLVNKEFRGIDKITDVLSFPFDDYDTSSKKVLLGDVMINVNRCEEQGIEYGHGFDREIMYLTVHSVLHLLGYDHVDEGQMKEEMRKREKEIMKDD